MNTAPIQSKASAADIPLEQVANDRALTQPQKVAEVSRQFEALLLRQILQETQKTVIPSKYADASTTAGIYHDMVINQLADNISKSGTLGLAQSLECQLGRQLHPASPAGSGQPAGAAPAALSKTAAVQPTHLNHPKQFQPTPTNIHERIIAQPR
jgi:Rod binding domain-containing protein